MCGIPGASYNPVADSASAVGPIDQIRRDTIRVPSFETYKYRYKSVSPTPALPRGVPIL